MNVVGTVAHLAAMASGSIGVRYHQQVVFAVVLNHATAFQQSLLVFLALENLLVGSLDDIREVGFQFHQFAGAIDHKHPSVVIEEERAVVEVAHP